MSEPAPTPVPLSTTALPSLALCADDYAQSPAISAGIRALARWRCLHTVSCMSTSPHWPEEGPRLRDEREDLDLGLHFDLTHPFEGPRPPLRAWLARSLRKGGIRPPEIRDAFLRQWDRFTTVIGRAPDHLDGHQHVHLLPGIRQGVRQALDELQVRLPVRRIGPPPPGSGIAFKHRLAAWLTAGAEGGCGCGGDGAYAGFPGNPAFAGFRRFSPHEDFGSMMESWLAILPAGGLIMCHPGHRDEDPDDPIRACRSGEYDYLASRAFEAHRERFRRWTEIVVR